MAKQNHFDPIPNYDFSNYIRLGMKNAWHNIFLMTGRLHEEVRPEYITTSAMCFSLSENVGFLKGGMGFFIKAEHDVKRLLKSSSLVSGVKLSNVEELDSIRMGRVDITLNKEINGWRYPCAVIENKSYIRLESGAPKKVKIRESEWSKVSEDIKRNIAIMRSSAGNTIRNTASTFYVSNDCIVLKGEADKFLDDLKREVERLLKTSFPGIFNDEDIFVAIDAFEIEGEYYDNRDTAEAIVDDTGCPEYIFNGVWFLAGVVVSLSQ